jgi:hypothetical protein
MAIRHLPLQPRGRFRFGRVNTRFAWQCISLSLKVKENSASCVSLIASIAFCSVPEFKYPSSIW